MIYNTVRHFYYCLCRLIRDQVVVVPVEGDPDLYVSFDTALPTGANYTFYQDRVGVDEFSIGRYAYILNTRSEEKRRDSIQN